MANPAWLGAVTTGLAANLTAGTAGLHVDERPKNWREMIFYQETNGDAPLTALLQGVGHERTDDPEFSWWTELLPEQRAAVSGIYTDTDLTNTYTGGCSTGDRLYVAITTVAGERTMDQFRAGHQVLLRDTDDERNDTSCKVIEVNDQSNYIAVRVLEDDPYENENCDAVLIVGNINPEMGDRPTAISYKPVKYYNYTQIFRTPLKISRTLQKTRLRSGDKYQRLKRRGLQLHLMEIEKALMWGVRSEYTNEDNNEVERTTRGIIPWIRSVAPSNISNYTRDANYAGQTWLSGGADWLNNYLSELFKYGSNTKLCFLGNGALRGINRLAEEGLAMQAQPGVTKYGMNVRTWIHECGTLVFKLHPLFSYEPTTKNSMLIVDVDNLKWRYIDETFFKPDKSQTQGGGVGRDGKEEEWLTEAGLEMHFPNEFGYLSGIGSDNNLA